MISVQDSLNQDIWNGDQMRPEVRAKLTDIASTFLGDLGIALEVDDIILTGSMANFNYTDASDLDLHVLYNPADQRYDKLILAELFLAKKTVFNEHHRIMIKNHPVELYVQDSNEVHTSTGVFSILNDTWVKEPVRGEIPAIDDAAVLAKADELKLQIDNALGDTKALECVRHRVKEMRTAGLHMGGEFSVENLAFKNLRNEGYLEKLIVSARQAQDLALSLESQITETPVDVHAISPDGSEVDLNMSHAMTFIVTATGGLASIRVSMYHDRLRERLSKGDPDYPDDWDFRAYGDVKPSTSWDGYHGRAWVHEKVVSFWDGKSYLLKCLPMIEAVLADMGLNAKECLYDFPDNPAQETTHDEDNDIWASDAREYLITWGQFTGQEEVKAAADDWEAKAAAQAALHFQDPVAKAQARAAGTGRTPEPPTPRQLGGYPTMVQRHDAAHIGDSLQESPVSVRAYSPMGEEYRLHMEQAYTFIIDENGAIAADVEDQYHDDLNASVVHGSEDGESVEVKYYGDAQPGHYHAGIHCRIWVHDRVVSSWRSRSSMKPTVPILRQVIEGYGLNPSECLFDFPDNPNNEERNKLLITWQEFTGESPVAAAPDDWQAKNDAEAELHMMDPVAKGQLRAAGKGRSPEPPTPRNLGGYPNMAQRNYNAVVGDSDEMLPPAYPIMESPDTVDAQWAGKKIRKYYRDSDGRAFIITNVNVEGGPVAVTLAENGSGHDELKQFIDQNPYMDQLVWFNTTAELQSEQRIDWSSWLRALKGRVWLHPQMISVPDFPPIVSFWSERKNVFPKCLKVLTALLAYYGVDIKKCAFEFTDNPQSPYDHPDWPGEETTKRELITYAQAMGEQAVAAPDTDWQDQANKDAELHMMDPVQKAALRAAGKGREPEPPTPRNLGGYPDMARRNFYSRVGDSLIESPDKVVGEYPDGTPNDPKRAHWTSASAHAFLIANGNGAISTSGGEVHPSLIGTLIRGGTFGLKVVGNLDELRKRLAFLQREVGSYLRKETIQGRVWNEKVKTVSFWATRAEVLPSMPVVGQLLKEIGVNIEDCWFEFTDSPLAPKKGETNPPSIGFDNNDPWNAVKHLLIKYETVFAPGWTSAEGWEDREKADMEAHMMDPVRKDQLRKAGKGKTPPPLTNRHLGGYPTMAQRNAADHLSDSLPPAFPIQKIEEQDTIEGFYNGEVQAPFDYEVEGAHPFLIFPETSMAMVNMDPHGGRTHGDTKRVARDILLGYFSNKKAGVDFIGGDMEEFKTLDSDWRTWRTMNGRAWVNEGVCGFWFDRKLARKEWLMIEKILRHLGMNPQATLFIFEDSLEVARDGSPWKSTPEDAWPERFTQYEHYHDVMAGIAPEARPGWEDRAREKQELHLMDPVKKDQLKQAGKGRDIPPPTSRHLGGYDVMAKRNDVARLGDSADEILAPAFPIMENPDAAYAPDGKHEVEFTDPDAVTFMTLRTHGVNPGEDFVGGVAKRMGTHYELANQQGINYYSGSGDEALDWFSNNIYQGGDVRSIGMDDDGNETDWRAEYPQLTVMGRAWTRDRLVSFWDDMFTVKQNWAAVEDILSQFTDPKQCRYEFIDDEGLFVDYDHLMGITDIEAPDEVQQGINREKAAVPHILEPVVKDQMRKAGALPTPEPPTPSHLGGFSTMAKRNYNARIGDSIVDVLLPEA